MKHKIPLIKYIIIACSIIGNVSLSEKVNKDSITTVFVGMYVNRINEISVRSQSFESDFYFWLKWNGKHSPDKYVFVNGQSIERNFEVIEEDTEGYKYLSVKIRGKFITPMDVSRYPMDKHILNITIEDYNWNDRKMKYVVDTTSTGMKKFGSSGEWNFHLLSPTVKRNKFLIENEYYSSYTFQVEAVRSIAPFMVKIFLPILIVVLMSMLTFFIPPDELEAQVGLGATALLTIIALNFVISDQLPEVAYLTTADLLLIGSYITVFLALCESLLVSYFYRNDKIQHANRIDKYCQYAFPITYSVFLFILFLW